MIEIAVVAMGVCLVSVFINIVVLALNVKVYTEFAKERFKGRD